MALPLFLWHYSCFVASAVAICYMPLRCLNNGHGNEGSANKIATIVSAEIRKSTRRGSATKATLCVRRSWLSDAPALAIQLAPLSTKSFITW